MKRIRLCLLSFICCFALHGDEMTTLIETFEPYANTAMQSWNVPGMAIAIVKDGKTVYSKGFGVRKMGEEAKVDTHTLFQIGSLSKSFTATLMGIMVDEGKLNWTDGVSKYYPDFVLYDPWATREFQIQDLLAQRSGLPSNAGDYQSYLGYDQEQILHNLRYIKPVSSFRSTYAYQNSFFLVAGEILSRLSGRTWDELIEERLFDPLDMKESNLSLDDYRNSKNVASGHVLLSQKTIPLSNDFPYAYAPYLYAPAGGINSTLEDMTKWLKFQLDNGVFKDTPLISEGTMSQLRRRYIYMGNQFKSDNYYCLGWISRDYSPYPIIGHSGGTDGSASLMAFIPEANVGIVILSNKSGSSLNYALAWQFFDMYYKKPSQNWSQALLEIQLKSEDVETPPSNPQPPLPFSAYAGIYYNAMYGKVEVSQLKDELILTMGPKKVQLGLKPWNRDTFTAVWPQVNDVSNTKVFFNKNVEGFPTEIVIELLQNNSDGTFQRL